MHACEQEAKPRSEQRIDMKERRKEEKKKSRIDYYRHEENVDNKKSELVKTVKKGKLIFTKGRRKLQTIEFQNKYLKCLIIVK